MLDAGSTHKGIDEARLGYQQANVALHAISSNSAGPRSSSLRVLKLLESNLKDTDAIQLRKQHDAQSGFWPFPRQLTEADLKADQGLLTLGDNSKPREHRFRERQGQYSQGVPSSPSDVPRLLSINTSVQARLISSLSIMEGHEHPRAEKYLFEGPHLRTLATPSSYDEHTSRLGYDYHYPHIIDLVICHGTLQSSSLFDSLTIQFLPIRY